jgi:hypothetical protein
VIQKTELEKRLEAYDLAGVTFHQAKKELLSAGYSENEITRAASSHPFDGKKNEPQAPTLVTKIYQEHPQLAQEVANTLMEQEKLRQVQQTRAAIVKASFAHPFGRINPVSTAGMAESATALGLPLFWLIGFGVFITAILYGMSTFNWLPMSVVWSFLQWYSILIAVLFVYSAIKSEFKAIKGHTSIARTGLQVLIFLAGAVYIAWTFFSFFV